MESNIYIYIITYKPTYLQLAKFQCFMASPEEEKWPSLSTGAIGNGMPSCGASSAGGEHLQSVIGVQQSSRGRDRSLTEKPEGFHDVWILYVFLQMSNLQEMALIGGQTSNRTSQREVPLIW